MRRTEVCSGEDHEVCCIGRGRRGDMVNATSPGLFKTEVLRPTFEEKK